MKDLKCWEIVLIPLQDGKHKLFEVTDIVVGTLIFLYRFLSVSATILALPLPCLLGTIT